MSDIPTRAEIELYEILNDYAESCVKLAQDFQEGKRISFTAGWNLTQETHNKITLLFAGRDEYISDDVLPLDDLPISAYKKGR